MSKQDKDITTDTKIASTGKGHLQIRWELAKAIVRGEDYNEMLGRLAEKYNYSRLHLRRIHKPEHVQKLLKECTVTIYHPELGS